MDTTCKLRCMTSLYLLHGERILLLYRQGSRVIADSWVGAAGGHFEPEELNDPRACVLRELREELSLEESDICNLQMRYITLRRTEKGIRQNYYFFARLSGDEPPVLSSNEGILRWFSLNELEGLEMPRSARGVIDHYLSTGRHDHTLRVGITDGTGTQFTELPVC